MGLASSSAVRVDHSYGSLGGAFGGTGRVLKKKPVLVLDPEELAKAHQLFQIGAAEQLGDFDPKDRVHRPAAALFSPILGAATFHDDEDDDYTAPADLAFVDLSDDEEAEDDLPPIDLDSLLALTRAEQEAEDAYYLAQQEVEAEALPDPAGFAEPEDQPEPEPQVAAAPTPPVIAVQAEPESFADELLPQAEPAPVMDADSPADALARIISRAASLPKPAPEPAAEVVLPEPVAEPEITAAEPAWLEPAAQDAQPIRTFDPAPEPATEPAAEEQPFDLSPQDEFDGEAFVRPEAPLRVLPILADAAPRSQLRARLVREDLTAARPAPGVWRRIMMTIRRWRYSLPF